MAYTEVKRWNVMESLRETVHASDDNRELFAARNPLRSSPEYSNSGCGERRGREWSLLKLVAGSLTLFDVVA
jgi:hypothetical protein